MLKASVGEGMAQRNDQKVISESLSATFSQETAISVWNEVRPAELSDLSGGGVMDKPRLFPTV